MQSYLPSALLTSLKYEEGFDLNAFVEAHQSDKQITSIRINPFKPFNVEHSSLELTEKVAWCDNGYYLLKRPTFTTDPFFHAGAYYVQEASSMFLEEVLKQTCKLDQSLKVLDLCAAPGGKSTLIESVLSTDSILVSNEVIKTRVNVLTENITKWGAANTVVSNNDPKDFQRLTGYFDVIVVDAPCSGSGLFRKDQDAVDHWSEENVLHCSQRQQRILADVMPALKQNGVLIYSTCSFSKEENEIVVDWLVENQGLETVNVKINGEWGITQTTSPKHKAAGYRFYPNKVKGEGFFISTLRKKNNSESHSIQKAKSSSLEKISTSESVSIRNWINKKSSEIQLLKWKDDVIALSDILLQEAATLQNALYIKKMGINIGTTIRKELIPSHQLAMSRIYSPEIPTIELDKETALNYLRLSKFNVEYPIIGWNLIQYSGRPLGFVKCLQNRINNYYPKEWRILHR